MGTNFYWRESCLNPCDHCGLPDFHVGKRSAGWSFGFRAWRTVLMDDDHPDWGHIEESPFGFEVRSRADWRRVFTSRSGLLMNEYGDVIDDAVAWLDALTPPDADKVRWEDEHLSRGYFRLDSAEEWRDREGFRFCAREFS